FYASMSEGELSAKELFDTESRGSKLSAVEVSDSYAWFLDLEKTRAVPVSAIKALSTGVPYKLIEKAFLRSPWAMSSDTSSLYFATPGGKVSHFEEREVLATEQPRAVWSTAVGETAFALEIDSLHRAWVATSSGLWLRHEDGVFRLEIRTIGVDAIAADYGASHTDTNGNIYFGGTGGLISIRRPNDYPLNVSGSVVLTKIRVDDRDWLNAPALRQVNQTLRVEGLHKKIHIEYDEGQILLSRVNEYQHKLEGFDTDWQDTGSVNVATYQNLAPGNYTFRARGANSAGVWSDNEISLPIKVLPPAYLTWWAFLSYLVLGLAAFLYLKGLNDRNIARKERLKLAEEGSAAFARLEDDYQAQREANEVLLLRRTPAANKLLDVIETALAAQFAGSAESPMASAVANKIFTLRSLQTLTNRTTSEERTDLHAVTNEIAARLAQSNELASRAIITNDVCKDPIRMDQAIYISLVIQESLELATTGRTFNSSIDPMVYITLDSPLVTNTGELRYELRIEDSGLKDSNSDTLERLLPLTFHLIETGGGELSEDYDAGNTLSIKLLFPGDNSSSF
ncbi:triple tyrosine motif-containing protein, partial [Congregibacter sp.]|uniref:triple tyrosine motif-containing protein n=1 Tax=Congregibacter sp. TaxID=2744308 RepID=UPI003F6D2671